MKRFSIFVLSIWIIAACASRPHRTPPESAKANGKLELSATDLSKIDKTIANVNSEIDELQSLNDKMYEKSLTADPKIEKEFDKKVGEYGSFESLQADLKLLNALKTDKVSQTDKK